MFTNLIYSILSVIIQSLVGLYFLPSVIKLQNSSMTILDAFQYIAYFISVFITIRILIFIPIAKVLSFISKKLESVSLTVFETIFFVLILIDSLVYTDQGIHIFDKVVLKAITNPNANREFQFSTETFITLGLIVLVAVVLKYFLLKFTRFMKHGTHIWRPFSYLVLCFLLLAVGNTATYFKTYIESKGEISNYFALYPAIKGSPGQHKLKVNYSFNPKEIKLTNKENTLFILAESLRGDYLTKENMPKTWQFLQQRNCHISKYHFSGGHTTEYGVFTSLYGVYGYHYDNFSKERISSYALDVLKENGYKLLGSSASSLSTWNNAGFITDNFSPYKEFTGPKVYLDDTSMIDWTLKQIKELQKEKSPIFAFNFFNSTHHNYFYPKEFEVFKPTLEEDHNHFMPVGDIQEFRQKIINRYKNSVLYLDHILSDYLKKYFALSGDNSRVIISGDHGEAFWEEGLLGHGKSNYINPNIRVPLAMCNMGEIDNKLQRSSHVDLMPTLLHSLGAQEGISEKFNGYSYLSEDFKSRPYMIVVGPQFPYGRNKLGLVTQNHKFWLKKPSKELHKFYKYRITNLDDINILDKSANEEFFIFEKLFEIDAYKFLELE